MFETLLFGWSLKTVEGICQCLKNNTVLHLSTTQIIMTAEVNSHEKVAAPFGHSRENGIVEIIYALFWCFQLH